MGPRRARGEGQSRPCGASPTGLLEYARPANAFRGDDRNVIDKDLLSILACPATHQPLREASAAELAALNGRIAKGGVTNVGGKPVKAALEAGLVRADSKLIYAILNGIPVLLTDEGIAL